MHNKKAAQKLKTAALTGVLSLSLLGGETLPFLSTAVYAAAEEPQAGDGAKASQVNETKEEPKKDDASDKKEESKKDSAEKKDDNTKDGTSDKQEESKKDESADKKDESADKKEDTSSKSDSADKKDEPAKGETSTKDDTSGADKGNTSGSSKVDEASGTEKRDDKNSEKNNSSSSVEETKPPASSSKLPETEPSASSSSKLPETGGTGDNLSENAGAAQTPSGETSSATETEEKQEEDLSDEDELKREEEIANEEDDDDGQGNEELISHQTIIHLPNLEEDFRFFTVARVYGFAKDRLYIYEETSEKATKVGELEKNGLAYILKTGKDGWYYIESGKVRGFVKKDSLYTGDEAQKMLEDFQTQAKSLAARRGKAYEGITSVTKEARALVDWDENDAFSWYRGTTVQTVIDKVFALATTETTVRDSQSKKGKSVGKMAKDALCYVIADQEKDWVYIESGNVRGFVKKEDLEIADSGNGLAMQILQKGSSTYETASQSVDPDKNKALYYTLTSIRSGSQTDSIRSDLLKYAAQYAGNPYKWGGSSLTHGTDCSGFAMRVYQKFGYKLPRTSRAQSHCGTKVAVEDARPGDLIFYAKKGRVYHVAIYAGNGKTIEAANEKLGICSLKANRKNAVWAVHLIKDENEKTVTESNVQKVNTKKEDQGKLLGEYRIIYYSPGETETEKAGDTKTAVTPLIEGNTVAVSEQTAKEGEKLIINGHLYTATNTKTDIASDEMAIYVSSPEKETTLERLTQDQLSSQKVKTSVYKAKS